MAKATVKMKLYTGEMIDIIAEHRDFTRYYALLNNLGQAYIAVYGETKGNTKYVGGYQIMKRDECIKAHDHFKYMLATKLALTEERILKEIATIALSNPAEMFEADGSIKNIKELPEVLQRCIESVDVRQDKDGNVISHKIKFYNKLTAIKLAAEIKNFGEVGVARVRVITDTVNKQEQIEVIEEE